MGNLFFGYHLKVIERAEFQGLRPPRNRSLLNVNEDFEEKRNAESTLFYNFTRATSLFL